MTSHNTATRFGLVRHAMTVWNREKRIQGQTDTALAEEGVQQARTWGPLLEKFRWNRILCSDLGRAKMTADLINACLKLPLTFDHRLREQDWGRWVGKTVKQLRREEPQLLERLEAAGWKFHPPGGEERNAMWERTSEALVRTGKDCPGENILVVCHGGVIKTLIYRLSERRFLPSEPPLIRPYHLHWLRYDTDDLRVEEINALDLNAGFKGQGPEK